MHRCNHRLRRLRFRLLSTRARAVKSCLLPFSRLNKCLRHRAIPDQGAEGFSSQALQQGGIGLLLTVLIISVPPLAAAFFQGTVGQFMHFSAFGGGYANRPGPQGQPPGSYGAGQSPSAPTAGQAHPGQLSGAGGFGGTAPPLRVSNTSGSALADVVKVTTSAPSRGNQ